MLGDLTRDEIDALLAKEAVGRIGCHAAGRTYVVPVTYVYDGEDIYGHSAEGMKVRMMRENPHVCFEAEQVEDLVNWKSVIVWGNFEELEGEEAIQAMQLLLAKLAPRAPASVGRGRDGALASHAAHAADVLGRDVVIYRINISEKTGRFERR